MNNRNIAVISTNKDTYSETFIHNHVKLIPGNIHFLYDGYLPKQFKQHDANCGYLETSYLKKSGAASNQKSEKSTVEDLKEAIENYLIKNSIALIFAEYGPSGVEMLPFAKKLRIPLLVHFHGFDAYRNDILEGYGKNYSDLFAKAGAIVVVSKHMYSHLLAMGCAASKLHYIPYGIDTTLFKNEPSAQAVFEFVSCGRFVEKKAPQLTIRAFAEVLLNAPSAKLVMIGDGKLQAECIELATHLGIINSIRFAGKITQHEIAAIFQQSLVFVQHSIISDEGDSEGTPLSILESAACGLAAVSTRHAGIVDIVEEGVTGFLVDERDVSGMADKMLQLIRQPDLAKRMGDAASKKISQNYTIEKYTEKLSQLLETLL